MHSFIPFTEHPANKRMIWTGILSPWLVYREVDGLINPRVKVVEVGELFMLEGATQNCCFGWHHAALPIVGILLHPKEECSDKCLLTIPASHRVAVINFRFIISLYTWQTTQHLLKCLRVWCYNHRTTIPVEVIPRLYCARSGIVKPVCYVGPNENITIQHNYLFKLRQIECPQLVEYAPPQM